MKQRGSGSYAALLEMIIVVLLFSLAAAVCVQVFAAARKLERHSKSLTEATLAAQNIAEAFYISNADASSMQETLPMSERIDDASALTVDKTFDIKLFSHTILALYYDSTWQRLPPSRRAAATYTAVFSMDEPDKDCIVNANINIFSDKEKILETGLCHYVRDYNPEAENE